MIKVFFLIFEPNAAWEKIARARRGIVFITVTHLLPFLLLGAVLEYYGLKHDGKWQPQFKMFKTFQQQDIMTFEVIQGLLLLVMVFIAALLVYKISQTFQDRLNFLQVFATVAYGFSPLFLIRFLDGISTMHPATTWLLGIGLTMWILYQGIPRVMMPDPTHAFGVYLSAMFVVLLTSGLERLITAMYLLGYMDFHHSWLSNKIAPLLGH